MSVLARRILLKTNNWDEPPSGPDRSLSSVIRARRRRGRSRAQCRRSSRQRPVDVHHAMPPPATLPAPSERRCRRHEIKRHLCRCYDSSPGRVRAASMAAMLLGLKGRPRSFRKPRGASSADMARRLSFLPLGFLRASAFASLPRQGTGNPSDLREGKAGIIKLAAAHGVGVGTVQRIKASLTA